MPLMQWLIQILVRALIKVEVEGAPPMESGGNSRLDGDQILKL